MTTNQKFLAAVLLFAAWGALVFLQLVPVDQFVTAIRDALISLGVFSAALTNPKGD